MKISSGHASQAVSHEQGADNVSVGRTSVSNDALDLSRFACEESNEHLPFVASGLHAHTGGEH